MIIHIYAKVSNMRLSEDIKLISHLIPNKHSYKFVLYKH
ncbi:hypothetical protein MNB_SUP05-SYMBIONT-4-80 [hydrothermal vent metagenome]|uniref:Uncharacterized protein n=1 Tax=hydrothermal vent metagenome TaxID=652676 RepID=A0A1W1E631_9ZZZZ